MPEKTCIVISGPTAIGKTSIAIQLAEHFNTEIISADSRQCFKETTIAVAKPTAEELQQIQHYFINSHSIFDKVTAATFEKYALNVVQKIFDKTDFAVLVGGTGLYIKAFIEGLDRIPEADPVLREKIISDYQLNGLEWLQLTVQKEDPDYFKTGEQSNPQRLMRALEVKRSTGNSIRVYQVGAKQPRNFKIIHIGLQLPRNELNERIEQRVDQMVNDGLIEEARSLYPFKHLNALQTVGYTELFDHFDVKISLDEAIESIKIHTRQYAKRQVTWFQKANVDSFVSPGNLKAVIDCVDNNLQAKMD